MAGVLLYFSSCASAPSGTGQPPETDYVTASWYGPKFHGKPTASGEIFNMYAMTCAHKTFPFGTKLRVTNTTNNKSAIVTVNDRGPFIRGRDLDLSYGAARKIGLLEDGVARVRIQYLGRDMHYVKTYGYTSSASAKGPFTIQTGSFKEKSHAERLRNGLKIKYRNVYMTTTYVNGQKFYRIRIGNFDSLENAHSVAKTLSEEGYSIFITKKE